MNKLSSLLCQLSLLAIVGGGITFGVAYASGEVSFADCIRESIEYKKVSYEKNERQEALDVNLAVSNVTLFPATDDKFTIDITTTMGRKTGDAVVIDGFDVDSTVFHNILNSFGENLDKIAKKTKNICNIYIPSWYTSKIEISVIVGSITSYIPVFTNSANFKIVTGDIKVEEVKQVGDINLSTVTGKLSLDVSKVADPTNIKCRLKAVTGKISFFKNSEFLATYHTSKHIEGLPENDSTKNNVVTMHNTTGSIIIETK